MIMLLLMTAAISDSDANAAVMYVQSYTVPALFKVCKSSMPNRVDDFDKALAAWREKNAVIVARGESVVLERTKQDNVNVQAMFSSERDSMVSQLKSLSQQEKAEKCEYMLQVTRAEK